MIDVFPELFLALVVLPAAVGVLWRYRARRKWRALLDAYAEQEIARTWRFHRARGIRAFPSPSQPKTSSRRNVHARPHS